MLDMTYDSVFSQVRFDSAYFDLDVESNSIQLETRELRDETEACRFLLSCLRYLALSEKNRAFVESFDQNLEVYSHFSDKVDRLYKIARRYLPID
jgi:hypothetical protein